MWIMRKRTANAKAKAPVRTRTTDRRRSVGWSDRHPLSSYSNLAGHDWPLFTVFCREEDPAPPSISCNASPNDRPTHSDLPYLTRISTSNQVARKCEDAKTGGQISSVRRKSGEAAMQGLVCDLVDRLGKTSYVAGGNACDRDPTIFGRVDRTLGCFSSSVSNRLRCVAHLFR